MLCTVTRTLYLGEKRHEMDPGPTITGTVRMYSILREDMKRYIHVMPLDGLQKFGATEKGSHSRSAAARTADILVRPRLDGLWVRGN